MADRNSYVCLSCKPRERGSQKLFVDNDLFEFLGASLGQCACLCLHNKVYVCKIWPRPYDEQYMHFDGSVYCIDNSEVFGKCMTRINDKGLKIARKESIHLCNSVNIKSLSVKLVVKTCKLVKFYKKNLSMLNDAVRNVLKFSVLKKGCAVEASETRLGEQYGLAYIIVCDMQPNGNLVCGKIGQKVELAVDHIESMERFQQRKKFKNINLGGLHKAEQTLKELIKIPLKKKAALKSVGVTCSKGILLRGPAGCGKSSLLKSVAFQCGAYLLCVDGPELTGPRPGETEANLRQVFDKALMLSEEGPCILFFDKIDYYCSKKNKGDSQRERVLAQLVQLLDRVSI